MSHKVKTDMGEVETVVPVSKEQRAHMQAHARALMRDDRTDEQVIAEYERIMAEKRKREAKP